MKLKKTPIAKRVKETPASRKARVSSGIRFRAAVFADKRRKTRDRMRLDSVGGSDPTTES